MEPINIHIATHKRYLTLFRWLTKLVGAVYSVETPKRQDLRSVIAEGEADFAAGRGKTFTVEELEAMMNEHA